MKRLGDVVATHGAVAVVRCDEEAPVLDAGVVDEEMSDVGRIVDAIGPVDDPYAVVQTERTEIGDRLYIR